MKRNSRTGAVRKGTKTKRKVLRKVTAKRGTNRRDSTRTSTDASVRSPTRTSTATHAKTSGNITVTGGAGSGNTSVSIRARGSKANPQVGDYELTLVRSYPTGMKRFTWKSLKGNASGAFYMDVTGYWWSDGKGDMPPVAIQTAAKQYLKGKAA